MFGKSEIIHNEFTELVFQWNKEVFQCKVVRRAWNLISGFILWMIWKERNRRVFQDISKKPKIIWERTVKIMQEKIMTEKWDEEDWKENQV